jgi:hypothetical protein
VVAASEMCSQSTLVVLHPCAVCAVGLQLLTQHIKIKNWIIIIIIIIITMTLQPIFEPCPLQYRGFLITNTHAVGLFWTSDQPVAQASTYTGQHNI